MSNWYILEGHQPVPVSILEAGGWKQAHFDRCIVRKTKLAPAVEVSTVFLALDHRMPGAREPELFETMVFGSPKDGECWRYATWEQAEQGHARMVRIVERAIRENLENTCPS